jgi:uncharacterized protein (UPF0264 family)
MSRMLASVTNVEEALIALQGGADIIDLKNPSQGALGALSLDLIREIVKTVDHRKPVSATIGDFPMQPESIVPAVRDTAATGVDIVKIGFFGREGHEECIRALQPLAAQGVRMVAVLFADNAPDFGLIPQLAYAGIHGVMLDTAIKNGKRLRDHLDDTQLRSFVEQSHERNLLAGLAGSLAISDVEALIQFDADYLGFRGALCHGSERKAALDSQRLSCLKNVLYSCNRMSKEFA